MRLSAISVLTVVASLAHAEPTVLKLATVAPDGTTWAHEMKAFAQEVESASRGDLRVKWVWGGLAGDDVQVSGRIDRGQLDGTASGGILCTQLAPTMRVMRIAGLFQTREEATYVVSRLSPRIDEEFRSSGYVNLVLPNLGPDVVMTNQPFATFDELRKLKLWRWDVDELGIAMGHTMGLTLVTTPVADAGRALDQKQFDGMLGIPAAALAFQWYTKLRYVMDLHMGFLVGCIVVSNRSYDRLPLEHQQILKAAAAKLNVRADLVGRHQDDMLLGGVFQRQGMKTLPVTAPMRQEFFEAARDARKKLGEKLVPEALLREVLGLLADFRVLHNEPRP
jgi:TRAP-type C4-dicarboxylate transport system substrate-binding protein